MTKRVRITGPKRIINQNRIYYHEAGHAVLGHNLGGIVRDIAFGGDGGGVSWSPAPTGEAYRKMLLAGGVAEVLAGGARGFFEWLQHGSDLKRLSKSGCTLQDATRLLQESVCLVRKYWSMIDHVAEALQAMHMEAICATKARRSMSGEDFLDLIGQSPDTPIVPSWNPDADTWFKEAYAKV